MKTLGALIFLAGLVWLVVSFQMGTTITTPGRTVGEGEYAMYLPSQSVHNIGLIERRRSHLMAAGVVTLVGVLMMGFGASGAGSEVSPDLKPCPYCAEPIRRSAIKCRHCSSDLPESFRVEPPPRARQVRTRQLKPSELETMAALGISYENGRFRFGDFEYDGLAQAVIHAKAAQNS